MIFKLLILIPLSFVAASIWANEGKGGNVIVNEMNLDGCHFRLTDPYGGTLTQPGDGGPPVANYEAEINPEARRRFRTGIQFECHNNVSTKDLSSLAGIGKRDGRWIIDFDGDAEAANTRLYSLHGKGWEGAGITQDQAGEDGARRAFTFCIMHGSQALCGQDDAVMYLDYPEESVLPQLIRLLDSIEFVN